MKLINRLAILAAFAIVALASCTKTKNTNTGTVNSNVQQHNQDVQNTQSESDNNNTDVNSALIGTPGFGKTASAVNINICGATIDSSHANGAHPYIIITFDGHTVCPAPDRIRSGTVTVTLISGTSWVDAGAQVSVLFSNYKITYPNLNNAFIVFNGTKYLTDVSGINLLSFLTTGQASVSIRERTYNLTAGFENGYTANWNSARLYTWNYTGYGATITATVNGDTTINGVTTDSWGQTRFGTNFVTQMITPWQSGTTCGWWAPTQGQYTSVTSNFTVSALLGLDGNGNTISSGCASDFKLSWTLDSANVSGSILLPYY